MKNQQSRALAAPLPFRTPRILSTAAALRSAFFLCTLHSVAALAAPGQTSHPAGEREADRSPAPIEITVDLNDFEEIDADTLGATPHVFRGAGNVYLDGKLAAGTTTFRDASILDLAPGSSITAGAQYFRDTSTLITTWSTKIYGGQQVFTDRSTFSAADEILGGQQFFHDESTLSLGRSHVIMGGEQRFMDKSCLTATSQNPIKRGIQTFHDDSRVNASQRWMLDGGTQFFLDRSTLDINVPGALARNNAVFKDQSKIHLNVEQGIEPGTSIALSDSAGMHMFGHSVNVDTVESLDFHAQAFVQNGGDTDAVLTVNPRDIRQPFFNGHMRDGGTGKLGLIKEGPRTFYLAGEQAIAYSGDTEVKDGVLAIRGVAPGASHKTVLLNGGWLDISELPAESADQFELKGSYPAKVLRLADDDRRTVAAGQHETLDTPLGSGDTEDQGKYLVKTGLGKLTLDAENHYIGATRVQQGILSFSKNEQLGQEAVVRSLVLEGGSLELTADLHTDRTMELRTTAVVDTEATSSNWRSALQDAQPRTPIKEGSGALTFREESHLGSVKVEDGSISFLDTPKITAAAGEPAVAMGPTAKSASFAGGLIKSINAPAITAHAGDSRVDLLRMQAMAQDAPLAQAQGSAKLEIDANATQSSGSLAARESAGMRFTLTQGSRWTGAAEVRDNSQIHVAIADSTSRWNVTDNSVVTTLANAGTLQFGNAGPASGGAQASSPAFPALPTSPTDYASLHVQGDYAGGGAIRMRTKVDGDQALTDRLLIEGDASGETKLDVALEISGKQHKLSSVSLVQVGGNANADSFKLEQGEIMLKGSPFKHVLDAYGPAEMAAKPGRAPDWMLDKNPT
jgi:autotransporter-associated beta strand protein